MTSPYLRQPLRSLGEVRGLKITKLPDMGDALWLTEEAFYCPPPLPRRSHKRTYAAVLLCAALVALAFLIVPLVQMLGSL